MIEVHLHVPMYTLPLILMVSMENSSTSYLDLKTGNQLFMIFLEYMEFSALMLGTICVVAANVASILDLFVQPRYKHSSW